MWNIKPKLKQMNKHKLIGADNKLVVTRGEGNWGESKTGQEGNCMVTDENQTFGGEHNVVYTYVELQRGTPEPIYVT